MKAIIPVAGSGTRLKPHTLTKPKVLMNVAGKPMIHYIIEQLTEEKFVNEIIMITGVMGDMIKNYLKEKFKFNFKFIEQKKQLGLGHAVNCARAEFTENEDVLIILGDTLFDLKLKELCDSKYSVIGVKKVDDPKRFGVVERNKQGFISRFVEKPASPEVSLSNKAIVGIYYLKNSDTLFGSLDEIIAKGIKTKNEYQLTDALSNMLIKGEKLVTFEVENWLDCGKKDTILDTSEYFLKKFNNKYKYDGCILKQPLYIGENVIIENSIIGKNVTISDNCIIKNSIIKRAIIEEHSMIENAIIEDSLIGEHTKIKKKTDVLNLGDYSEFCD
ncbi:MAG: NTP transferase domain-containing protein [Ignavibacteria bacterium]|nr:NTP transferase domain-containing protein [Ignavibacteria bacterium]